MDQDEELANLEPNSRKNETNNDILEEDDKSDYFFFFKLKDNFFRMFEKCM